jgi:acyl-CoA synthetase (AMP-forming)/AMP-acid ligase II
VDDAGTWNDRLLEQFRGAERPAVVTAEGSWSGDELVRRAAGVGEWLRARGFAPGEGVPALVDESPATIALLAGAALVGRPLAPLGTRSATGELAGAVQRLAGTGLVTTPDLLGLATDVAQLAGVPVHVLDAVPSSTTIPEGQAGPDDVVVIVHTSGTTGAPQPVLVRHRQTVARLGVYERTMPLGPGDRFSSASPFHHTTGVNMVLTALGMGASVIPQARFTVEGWRAAGRLGVTHALLVPTMVDLLLEQQALADARPRVLQYGAAPIHRATLTEALAVLPDVEFLQIFGQTEVSPLTALTHADHLLGLGARPELLTTVGRPVPGVDLQVDDPDADGIGELIARAPHAFVVDEDGWRHTGDLGRIDDEGYVTLHGRRHDRIVWGGENIYPIEVEQVLLSHPAVREVAVVGVPDRRYGELVKAVVVPADPSAPPSAEELQRHARLGLAPFKVPSVIELADELPRNSGGKVLRRRLVDPPG